MDNLPKLFISIEDTEIYLIAGYNNDQNSFELLEKLILPIYSISNNSITDLDKIVKIIKKNVLIIEQKVNFTFKDIIIILNNFKISFLNLSGFKKLNGTQISKENITYILNSLKSYVDQNEENKKILHIFNSEYCLDKKKLDNLPIGLFGNFYTQELSFIQMDSIDYKNLENIFQKCNLRIKKILLKSFVKGAHISNKNNNIETFFQIQINESSSTIFYFENNSLKFEQKFKFGTNIIIQDISKITTLKAETVKMILDKIELHENIPNDEMIKEEFFDGKFKKNIKKKLVYEVALARIKEISEIILHKNINFKHLVNPKKKIFLGIRDNLKSESVIKILCTIFSKRNRFQIQLLNNFDSKEMVTTVNELVHFGWKKEAIPIIHSKKSLIARFFEEIFG